MTSLYSSTHYLQQITYISYSKPDGDFLHGLDADTPYMANESAENNSSFDTFCTARFTATWSIKKLKSWWLVMIVKD